MNHDSLSKFSLSPTIDVSSSIEESSVLACTETTAICRPQWKENRLNTYRIRKRENVNISTPFAYGIAVLPGEAITPEVLDRRKEREMLLSLIHSFATEGFSRSFESDGKITSDTAEASKLFFGLLPFDAQTPAILPDGEGGLVVAWERSSNPTILIIDDWHLHVIKNATTPQAEYFENLPFDGENIPNAVLKAIPI